MNFHKVLCIKKTANHELMMLINVLLKSQNIWVVIKYKDVLDVMQLDNNSKHKFKLFLFTMISRCLLFELLSHWANHQDTLSPADHLVSVSETFRQKNKALIAFSVQ